MDDWKDFCCVAGPTVGDDALERSAEQLIAKLESFGSHMDSALPRAGERKDCFSTVANEQGDCEDYPVSPMESTLSSTMSDARHTSSVCSDDIDAGLSQTSDSSAVGSRLYRQARMKQQQTAKKHDKENGASLKPAINQRSKQLIGKRDGDAGERLHQEGKEREARRRAALEAAEARAQAKAEDESFGVPLIDDVSAQLAAGRAGVVSDRLYDQAKEHARRQAEREREAEQLHKESARPVVSEGSSRIAAMLTGRDGPVQERLYATASERQERLLRASCIPEEERMPTISETSRRLAERANAGVPLMDRLGQKTGAGTMRPSAVPSELLESTHAPVINAKSSALAAQAQAKAWAEGNVHIAVEDRLIACASKPAVEPELPEPKPHINPNTERILQRRGPMAPIEERLTQGVKHVRPNVGSELDAVTLAPELSAGTKKMLAKKGSERTGSVVDRLHSWGAQHQRGEGNAALADLKYKFGGSDDLPPPPPKPTLRRETKRSESGARNGGGDKGDAGAVMAVSEADEHAGTNGSERAERLAEVNVAARRAVTNANTVNGGHPTGRGAGDADGSTGTIGKRSAVQRRHPSPAVPQSGVRTIAPSRRVSVGLTNGGAPPRPSTVTVPISGYERDRNDSNEGEHGGDFVDGYGSYEYWPNSADNDACSERSDRSDGPDGAAGRKPSSELAQPAATARIAATVNPAAPLRRTSSFATPSAPSATQRGRGSQPPVARSGLLAPGSPGLKKLLGNGRSPADLAPPGAAAGADQTVATTSAAAPRPNTAGPGAHVRPPRPTARTRGPSPVSRTGEPRCAPRLGGNPARPRPAVDTTPEALEEDEEDMPAGHEHCEDTTSVCNSEDIDELDEYDRLVMEQARRREEREREGARCGSPSVEASRTFHDDGAMLSDDDEHKHEGNTESTEGACADLHNNLHDDLNNDEYSEGLEAEGTNEGTNEGTVPDIDAFSDLHGDDGERRDGSAHSAYPKPSASELYRAHQAREGDEMAYEPEEADGDVHVHEVPIEEPLGQQRRPTDKRRRLRWQDQEEEPPLPGDAEHDATTAWRDAERSLFGAGTATGTATPLQVIADSPSSALKSERHIQRSGGQRERGGCSDGVGRTEHGLDRVSANGAAVGQEGVADGNSLVGQLQNQLSMWAEELEMQMGDEPRAEAEMKAGSVQSTPRSIAVAPPSAHERVPPGDGSRESPRLREGAGRGAPSPSVTMPSRKAGARGEVRISYAPASHLASLPPVVAPSLLEAAEAEAAEALAEHEASTRAVTRGATSGVETATLAPLVARAQGCSSRVDVVISDALGREEKAVERRDAALADAQAAKKEAAAARAEAAAAREAATVKEAELREMKSRAEGLQEQVNELRSHFEASEAALERARSAATEVSQELLDIQREVRAQGGSAKGAKAAEAKLEATRQEAAVLRKERDSLREELIVEREERLSAADDARRERALEVSRVKAEASKAADAERRRLQARIDELEAKIEEREGEWKDQTHGVARRVEAQVAEQTRRAAAELTACQEELQKARRQNEADNAAARTAQREMDARLEESRLAANEARSACAAAEDELRQLHAAAGGPGVSAGGGGAGTSEAERRADALEGQLAEVREELRKAQEDQLGATLRARRREKELREQLKKQGGHE